MNIYPQNFRYMFVPSWLHITYESILFLPFVYSFPGLSTCLFLIALARTHGMGMGQVGIPVFFLMFIRQYNASCRIFTDTFYLNKTIPSTPKY